MGQRRGVYVRRFANVDGGRSPNAYVPMITVELRAFFPPHLGHEEETARLLTEAYDEAMAHLAEAGEGDR